ncbi:S-layer homology domain-containing protein [Candidatus Peribacteria bacterium]|nr:MAG: S-layer homology domain-containing protein [Candidatus Peribacteria bacterium]
MRSTGRRDYDTSNIGRYTDRANWDLPSSVAISVLTQAGVLEGDPSGTFRASSTLNRAEFVQIIMRLLPPSDNREYMNCFPDVARGIWYEAAVCRAKSMGIVRGNVIASIAPENWKFEPNRPVQYEEAVKVLVKLYAYSAVETNGDNWYVPFINEAQQKGITISGVGVGDKLTRGEMARLAANFLAYSEGDLDLLKAAQSRSSSSRMSSSSRSSLSSSSRSSSWMSSASSMSSSSRSGTYDPLTDTSVRSQIVLLGQTTPALASAKFFSNNEPLNVQSLDISLASPSTSVDSFLVYDNDGRFLGTATKQGTSSVYRVSFPTDMLRLERRVDHSVYLRARLKARDSGGVSGEALQIATIQITGTGEWSNDTYNSSSSDSFPAFAVARAVITSVTNAGPATNLITNGNDQLLATFAFNTTATDSQGSVQLQQIRMQVQATGGTTVSNVELRQEGSDTTVPCTIAGNVVTCNSIPTNFGTITGTENFRVYGDVTVPGTANNPSLSLTINEPGTSTVAGDITWTDGTSSFTWIGNSSAPVVRGTQFQ